MVQGKNGKARELKTDLAELARKIRVHAVCMTSRSGASHVGTTLSMAELLAVLYGGILRISPSTVHDPERDRMILSKGHGCAGLYAVLAECGFFPRDWLETFYQNGGRLPGHVTSGDIPGVEVSTGSLGHGLSISCGMALAGKFDRKNYRVFTLLSDGELDEGSTWEAILFAAHHRLDNLVAIVDFNKLQGLGHVHDVLSLEPLVAKWESFGWSVHEIDGHDIEAIQQALEHVPYQLGRPTCVLAHTIKGKGVRFMEDQLLWHYRIPRGEEYESALDHLGERI